MKIVLVWSVMIALSISPAKAELVSSGQGGFALSHVAEVNSTTEDTFHTMVQDVSGWWLGDHSWSGDAANLSIETRAGGCFCEQLPGGGSVEHMRVVYYDPGKLIRLQGGLGPLQDMGINGAMTWAVQPRGGSDARIEWRYTVHGHREQGFKDLAPVVDQVIGQQLASLVKFLQE